MENNIVVYKQAQNAMHNGIVWDYKNNFIIHFSHTDNKSRTLCGLQIKSPAYGWRKQKIMKSNCCPSCQKRLKAMQKQVAIGISIS